MISKFALTLAGHFADREVYSNDKINIYKYGFELLLSTAINMLGILLTSMVMGITIEAVFFCTAFIPLRLAAGGYHAKHHWSCILGFNLIFLGFAVFHRYVNSDFSIHYSLIAVIISSILIWALAPVEAVNKPLKPDQEKHQRKRSLIIVCIDLAVILLFYAFEGIRVYSQILAFYTSGALAASLTLVAAAIANRKAAVIKDK